jgi:Mn2+/Fe2+ NRAMP family transporter
LLSFGIPQALIPLTWLTGRVSVMGSLRNSFASSLAVWGLALLITAFNISLLLQVLGL